MIYFARWSIRIFDQMIMSMIPPIISERLPICFPNFSQNLTPIKVSIPVVIAIVRAGKNILSVLAVSDTPTARASILVAIERNKSDFGEKTFLSTVFSSSEKPSRIILIPIYPRRINAIQ